MFVCAARFTGRNVTDFVTAVKAGKMPAHSTRGGLKDGFVKMSPYGPAVSDMAKAKEIYAEWQPKVFNSNDAKEGATAFVEKRDPVWTGT